LPYCNNSISNASSLVPTQYLNQICESESLSRLYIIALIIGIFSFALTLVMNGFLIYFAWRTKSFSTKLLSLTLPLVPIIASITILDPASLLYYRINFLNRMIILQFAFSFAVCSLSLLVTSFIDIVIQSNNLAKANFSNIKTVFIIAASVAIAVGLVFIVVANIVKSFIVLLLYFAPLGFIVYVAFLVSLIVVSFILEKKNPFKRRLIQSIVFRMRVGAVVWVVGGLGLAQACISLIPGISALALIISLIIACLSLPVLCSAFIIVLFPPRLYKHLFCCTKL